MRRTLRRLSIGLAATAATAAALTLVAPAAHATGASCDMGDGFVVPDGGEWSESDGLGGNGFYHYVCQDGTPVFTGWSYDEDPDTVPFTKREIQL
jgi:hypothetical protein